VELWLGEVESRMRGAVRAQTAQALAAFDPAARNAWVLQWPAMVVIAASAIWWAKDVEAGIEARTFGVIVSGPLFPRCVRRAASAARVRARACGAASTRCVYTPTLTLRPAQAGELPATLERNTADLMGLTDLVRGQLSPQVPFRPPRRLTAAPRESQRGVGRSERGSPKNLRISPRPHLILKVLAGPCDAGRAHHDRRARARRGGGAGSRRRESGRRL